MILVAGRFGAPLNSEQASGEWAVSKLMHHGIQNLKKVSILPERSHDLGKRT